MEIERVKKIDIWPALPVDGVIEDIISRVRGLSEDEALALTFQDHEEESRVQNALKRRLRHERGLQLNTRSNTLYVSQIKMP